MLARSPIRADGEPGTCLRGSYSLFIRRCPVSRKLYSWKFEKPCVCQPRLQATCRRNHCSEYLARPGLSRRRSKLHVIHEDTHIRPSSPTASRTCPHKGRHEQRGSRCVLVRCSFDDDSLVFRYTRPHKATIKHGKSIGQLVDVVQANRRATAGRASSIRGLLHHVETRVRWPAVFLVRALGSYFVWFVHRVLGLVWIWPKSVFLSRRH